MAENTIETFFETYDPTDSLAHHGIKGQKWGIRRFQNEDGTLTELGKKRYNKITEHYKNEKGEFSTRKSTKASAATALGGAATGFGLTMAGLPMLGLPIAAVAGGTAAIGAIKRERARRFLENTGTGDIKDISLDRRYATNFDFLGLGAIVNTAYGTHREKVAENIKTTFENTKMSDVKKTKEKDGDLKHSDASFEDFSDDYLEHWGIFGMKWGRRRFQYSDGSLTPEGRRRYLKGGDRAIRKAEKIQSKREKILSDRKKLYKHRNEFSKEEIDKAMERFASQDRLREQMQSIKDAKRQDKADYKRSKIEYKKLKLQEKQMKEQEKQAKLATEQKKIDTEQKNEVAEAQSKAAKWRERANKARSIYEFAKAGQDILSDMGITSKEGNESLLGALGEAMGIKDNSAAKAAAARKKAIAKETEDLNLESLRIKIANERRAFDNNYSEDKKRQAKEAVQDEIDRLNLESLRRKDATERMNFDSNYEKEKKRQSTQDIIDDLNLRQLIAKTEKAEYDAANPNKKGMSRDDIEDVVEEVLEKLGRK